MKEIKRRNFLKKTSLGLAGFSLMSNRVLGANDRVRIALIGCGGRGRYVARGIVEQGAELVYLCDLYEERIDLAENFINQVQNIKIIRTKDMQQVFDSRDVDAVVIATPDHWHGPASIMACQAGKDVYVEKPHAHNIWESQNMIKVARKYDRIIQAGTQNRSAPYILSAIDYIQSGKLGKIGLVKVYNLKSGKPFNLGKSSPKPKDFNWDAWLGPARERPYHDHIFKGGWHKFWDYSGGDIVDDGIHQLDIALLAMGDPGLPHSVSCSGGRLVHKEDDAEVPDVQIVAYDYNDFVMTFELTNYPRYMQKTTGTIRRNDVLPYWTQNATRIELYGTELLMTIGRHGGGWQVVTSGGKIVEQMYGRSPDKMHYKNFIEAVKIRKNPNAEINIAHQACLLVHMANIAHRTGNKKLSFDGNNENFIGSDEANKFLKRSYRDKYRITSI